MEVKKEGNEVSPSPGRAPSRGWARESLLYLKWRGVRWILAHDEGAVLRSAFLRKPIRHLWRLFCSLLRGSHTRDGDFFCYGLPSKEAFVDLVRREDLFLILGFSYCQKPMECPSGRFNGDCLVEEKHPICQSCFLGTCKQLMASRRGLFLIVPTVSSIGREFFSIVEEHSQETLLFLIASCEMSLSIFGDFGNMVGIPGMGLPLGGRVCHTMDAFALAERGIKPGRTVLSESVQSEVLAWIRPVY